MYLRVLRAAGMVAAAALGFACVETTAPLPPPEELLLVVNTGDATLSVVPRDEPGGQVRVGLGGAVPADARPAAGRLFAVVAAGSGDSLAVVDLRQRRLDAMIFLGAGAGALGAVVIGDTVALVALAARDSVARVHLVTGETTRVEVGHFPKDLALARGKLFVVNANVDPCPPPDDQCPVGESWITVLDPVRLTPAGGRDSIPLPGPGNASYAVVGADGRIYVLSAGGADAPAGRLSIVDPVTQSEVGSFGGFGDHPGPIAADRGERILVSSPTEGLMEFNTRTRSVVRGAGNAIPVLFNRGVAADSRNAIYGIEAGPCTGGASGRARVFRPDFTEASTMPLGPCARAATIALIPPLVEATARVGAGLIPPLP
jgi:hypothetical protein